MREIDENGEIVWIKRENLTTELELKLYDLLVEIWDQRDFIFGVFGALDSDEKKQEMIELIEGGMTNSSDIIRKKMEMDDRERDVIIGVAGKSWEEIRGVEGKSWEEVLADVDDDEVPEPYVVYEDTWAERKRKKELEKRRAEEQSDEASISKSAKN